MDSMKEWAIKYAQMGFAVFPLIPREKKPATKTGCKAATTNLQQIEDWWNKQPDYNIGIATGSVSGGLVVIDLDVDDDKGIDGYESLMEWQRENGEFPDTWWSITGRGGYHLLFLDQGGNKNKVGLYDGIDIRGEGGYIVAPPSIHPNGHRYEWEQGPGDFNIAQADSLVKKFLLGIENSERQGFKVAETIPKGERTWSMVRLIGCLKAKGLCDKAIRAAVNIENEEKCIPPLNDQELEKEVFTSLKRGWEATVPYYTKREGRGRNNIEGNRNTRYQFVGFPEDW